MQANHNAGSSLKLATQNMQRNEIRGAKLVFLISIDSETGHPKVANDIRVAIFFVQFHCYRINAGILGSRSF
jgi:hypothetical protein